MQSILIIFIENKIIQLHVGQQVIFCIGEKIREHIFRRKLLSSISLFLLIGIKRDTSKFTTLTHTTHKPLCARFQCATIISPSIII
jgi:hypothetical protein